MGARGDGHFGERFRAGSVQRHVPLRSQRVQSCGAEEAERRLVAASVGERTGGRECRVAVDAQADRAEPRLDRHGGTLDAAHAGGAAEDLGSGEGGIEAQRAAQPQVVWFDSLQHALRRPGVGDQPVDLPRCEAGILHRESRRLRLQFQRTCAFEATEGGVPDSCDDDLIHGCCPGSSGTPDDRFGVSRNDTT